MGKDISTLYAFNRGLVSPLALARQDLKRMALSAETQTNWMPRVLGAMSLRPGTLYQQSTKDDAASYAIPFVFSSTDTALVELTDAALRVVVNDVVITRPSVSSTVTNGNFDTDVAGWTDSDEAGGTSAWASGGYLSLLGNGVAYAIRDQQVTVAGGNLNVEHALAIYIVRGTVTLKLGSSQGGEQYRAATTLRAGRHSIALTPTGNFWIRLQANDTTATLVSGCTMEPAGAMTLVTPWTAADLQNVRYDQSGDVLFCAESTYRQQRIERQGPRSWSVVDYIAEDGPFRTQNVGPITLTASVLSGSGTLTASHAYFKDTNVGGLFRLASFGQNVAATITAEDTWTDPIRVTGVDNGRVFAFVITTIGTSTVTLQRSVGEPGDWTTVSTHTTNKSTTYNDTLDNQIIYYRIGVATGGYTALDSIGLSLSYAAGSIEGTAIVTGYTSTTSVSIDVLTAFGSTSATNDWWEGAWSDRRGWPSAVALYDGRLWWAGKDTIVGSVSDAFNSFSDSIEGDSGPIKRSIGSGPVDTINWLLPLGSLLVGTQGSELVAKASSLDEPLTPTAFSLKPVSTQGSADLMAIRVDANGVYVQRNGTRVYELAIGAAYTYESSDLTAIVPEIGAGGFRRITVQRQPDTRIHCVRTDGKVAILIFDRMEKVTCWVLFETDGIVEDAVVLPGVTEDNVYYTIRRVINGNVKRYREKWALESDAVGAARTVLTDSTLVWTGALSTSITGLTHLEGETVTVWANSKDLGTYTVVSGAITISEAATTAYVGLAYTARFKSAKLALGSATGNPLTQRQRLDHVGLVLADTHAQGLRYGQDFDTLDDMPLIEQGTTVSGDSIWSTYSEDSVELNGVWSNDTRLCLEAASPRPCTVLAAVITGAGHDKV